VKDGDCRSCHKQIANGHPVKGSKGFELTARGAALCTQCHEALGKKKVVHAPVKEGDCVACHKPHGTAERFLLDVGEDRSALCFGCHDDASFKDKYLHGPVAVGACTRCHDPHESNEPHLFKTQGREKCLRCHADFEKTMKEAAVIHSPVQLNQCYSCHEPHAAPLAGLLKKQMPGLCTYCHKKVGEKMTSAKFPHKPLLQEGGCATCHLAHFGKAKGILLADEKTVCLGCHDSNKLGTPPLKNIKQEISGKKYLHGPLRNGQCTGCHDPHGSNTFRILRKNYPSDLYVPYQDGLYDECLLCHEKNLLRFSDTTLYTKFRNGSRNLHYVHVVNKRKGRTCRICHEPHASNSPKLIRNEGVNFGEWKIPLNIQFTPTGGSCTPGCHKYLRYDRENPEKY
jgi:predicted CXXCH cytochrome family protein